MLYSIKDIEDLEKVEELASLQSQVKVIGLQYNLGEQNFHENLKKKHLNQLQIQLKTPLKI